MICTGTVIIQIHSIWSSVSNILDENLFLLFVDLQTAKNSLTEMEKRERRAMERKLSEMEEELKVSVVI